VALRTHARMASRQSDGIFGDINVIASRYRIPVDRPRHHRWVAWMALQDGRRSMAVRHYAEAVAGGDWRSVGRAAVALLHPGLAQRHNVSRDDEWVKTAQTWLEELRNAATGNS
jgi:hypothetical protein